MSYKPPLALPLPPTPSPSSHIQRYLSSLHRHHHLHVTEGHQRVAHERENGFEVFQDYRASGDSSSAGNWSEVIYRQGRDEGEEQQGFRVGEAGLSQRVHGVSRGMSGPMGRVRTTHRDMKGKARRVEDEEEVSDSETSSAERRAQRRQRRKDKKLMRHPPPPTPPLAPIAYKRPASTHPYGSEASVGSFILPPVKRRKGKADGMDLVRRFEASNVAVKRLTLRPGKGRGMFDRGASSAPAKPARRASISVEQPLPPRDQGYMHAWRRNSRTTEENHQKPLPMNGVLVPASPEQRGAAAVNPVAMSQANTLRPEVVNLNTKLPPPGLTNSSPWPSEIMASGRKDRSESLHSRRHSDGVLETAPQPVHFRFAPPRGLGFSHDSINDQLQLHPVETAAAIQAPLYPQRSGPPVSGPSTFNGQRPVERSGSYGVEHLTTSFGHTMQIRQNDPHSGPTISAGRRPIVTSPRMSQRVSLSPRRFATNYLSPHPLIHLESDTQHIIPPLKPLIVPIHKSPSVRSGYSSQSHRLDRVAFTFSPYPPLKTTSQQADPLIKLEPMTATYPITCTSDLLSPFPLQESVPRQPPAVTLDQHFTPPPLKYTPIRQVSRPILPDPATDNNFLSPRNPFFAPSNDCCPQDIHAMQHDTVSSPYSHTSEVGLPIQFDSHYELHPSDVAYGTYTESRGGLDRMQRVEEAEDTWRNFWKDRPAAI